MRGGKVRYGLQVSQYREVSGEIIGYFDCEVRRLTAINAWRESQTTFFFRIWEEDEAGNISGMQELE